MKVDDIRKAVNAEYIYGEENKDNEVEFGFASDLMSDVLTLKEDNIILLTGLCNNQTIRTVEMAGINYVLFCRGKKVTQDMIDLAKDEDITLMETTHSMFQASALLYNAGLKSVY